MSGQKIVIEPHTRVEGHLRVEVTLKEGVVAEARVSGNMWRGIEKILIDRTPKEAVAMVQRICGVCPVAHAVASARAVEKAYGWEVPLLAQKIRNLLLAASAIHDHLIHFYLMSLPDWIDIQSLNSVKTEALFALAEEHYGPLEDNHRVLLKESLSLLGRKMVFPFLRVPPKAHPEIKAGAEESFLLLSHALFALHIQRQVNSLIELFGGSFPHILSIQPGGVKISLEGKGVPSLSSERILQAQKILEEIKSFIVNYYMRDLHLLERLYGEWFQLGRSYSNYLVFPEFPSFGDGEPYLLSGGFLIQEEVPSPEISLRDFPRNLTEDITCAWYKEVACPLKEEPLREVLTPEFIDKKYTFVLAPRLKELPMEVGSAASFVFWTKTKAPRVMHYLENIYLKIPSLREILNQISFASVLGRHLARALKSLLYLEIAESELKYLKQLLEKGEKDLFFHAPTEAIGGEAEGFGLVEAPRGALYHRVVLKDGRIKHYQVITPSCWNMSPQDSKGLPGPCERALIGLEVRDPEFPLEVYRVVRSFDPCMACAVHLCPPKINS